MSAATFELVGQFIAGAVLSTTVMLNEQVAVLLKSSVIDNITG